MSAPIGNRLRRRLREMASYRDVLVRFPLVVALLLAATFVANLAIEEVGPEEPVWRALIGLACAAVAALSATLTLEAVQRRRGTVGAGARQLAAAVAGACGFCLVWFQDALHTSTWLLAVAVVALVPLSPYLAGGSGAAFRGFLGRLTFAFLLSAIGWNLLGGGLSLVFVSLNLLFGLEVPFQLYAHVAAITALLFAPLFWLALIPDSFDLADDCRLDRLSARAVGALGEWIAAPLILVYALILHAYAVKCLVGGGLPSGQSGWLVSGFGICLLVALIVCRPFMREERALARVMLRYWPWVLPVPLVLVVIAVAQRIGAYGVTPERYLLAALAAVLAVVALLQVLRRPRGDIRLMAAIPVVTMLVASFGPQGAEWTSIRSQSDRFLAIVEQPARDAEQTGQALAALRYLEDAGELGRVAPAGGMPASEAPSGIEPLARAWGLDPSLAAIAGSDRYSRVYSGSTGVALEGFDLLLNAVDVSAGRQTEVTLPTGELLRLTVQGRELLVSAQARSIGFALPRQMTAASTGSVAEATLVTLRKDGVTIGLLPATLSGSLTPEPTLEHLSGTVLLNARDWR
ncbi:MAG: hypothetical protein CMN25_14545 [Salinicola sp.]|nr:hypothetical protein [Salinicola sp.]